VDSDGVSNFLFSFGNNQRWLFCTSSEARHQAAYYLCHYYYRIRRHNVHHKMAVSKKFISAAFIGSNGRVEAILCVQSALFIYEILETNRLATIRIIDNAAYSIFFDYTHISFH